MTIIEQLNKLAGIAPEICRQDDGVFVIGDYHFWDNPQHGFCAGHIQAIMGVKGRPALDWLEGALEQVIEAQGWQPGTVLSKDKGWVGQAANDYGFNITEDHDTSCEALLAALIAALEGKG